QGDQYIIELLAFIDNKGKVQHKMKKFEFDLNALNEGDAPQADERWGGQADFPRQLIPKASFLPKSFGFFFVDPGTSAKYSYIAAVPRAARFVILHCYFEYVDRSGFRHTAEKTTFLDPNRKYGAAEPESPQSEGRRINA